MPLHKSSSNRLRQSKRMSEMRRRSRMKQGSYARKSSIRKRTNARRSQIRSLPSPSKEMIPMFQVKVHSLPLPDLSPLYSFGSSMRGSPSSAFFDGKKKSRKKRISTFFR
jgi:hypothetical protein